MVNPKALSTVSGYWVVSHDPRTPEFERGSIRTFERGSIHVIDLAVFPSSVQAALLVGAILVEAVVLYVGYGILERVATPLIETQVYG